MVKTKTRTKKEKIINLSISKLVNTKFREYALYVLTSRGIPSFYDSLTPIQRYILMNTPISFTKTISVVGKVIQDGYHHGSQSVEMSIARLARPYGNSYQLLEGYGFFGTEVTPEPAAARYTSVKINKNISEILKKYNYLNTKTEDSYNEFWLDLPIGLTQQLIGIAVGYKSLILPRKLEDIKAYLEGKRKSVKPYLKGFNGTIKKYNNLDKAWLLSAKIDVKSKTIKITDVPPLIKYTTLLRKLENLLNEYDNKLKINNNSDTKIHLEIIYTGIKSDEFKEIQTKLEKITSIIVTENPVFIKDNQVLVYDKVEEYLDDYKWQLLRLKYNDTKYIKNKLIDDIEYNKAKKKFITFILQKKRTVDEIDIFLSNYNKVIKGKLEALTSKKFTSDELRLVTELIKKLESELKVITKQLKVITTEFNKTLDPTEKRGIKSQQVSSLNLFDEILDEEDGIEVYTGEEVTAIIDEDI